MAIILSVEYVNAAMATRHMKYKCKFFSFSANAPHCEWIFSFGDCKKGGCNACKLDKMCAFFLFERKYDSRAAAVAATRLKERKIEYC